MDNFEIFFGSVYPTQSQFIREEIAGPYGTQLLTDMGKIIKLYEVYEKGAEFPTEGSNGDYTPSQLKFKKAAQLINKEARFLFAKKPDIKFIMQYDPENESEMNFAKQQMSLYQDFIDKVLYQNNFYANLLKAAKDCFIGKRVAWFVNFNEKKGTVNIDFIPSLEFAAEYDTDEPFKLSKIFTFYNMNDVESRNEQRIYKKKYWLENGYCYVFEGIYNGSGELVETVVPETKTNFTYIPAGVIVNDGLLGDVNGESDINSLESYESMFSKLSNSDIDAERKSMFPVVWARDMNPTTTKNLSTAPGSFWDLQTDQNANEGTVGEVGVIESHMSYSETLAGTLNRLTQVMHDELDVPDVTSETLKGVITSGKTLKALYWPLLVRCDEKMLSWKPAIEKIVKCLIDGVFLYPAATAKYMRGELEQVDYIIEVNNQYPLPEDEESEKVIDMQEVNNQVLSRKSYMMKWHDMTSDEADNELKQIAAEREILENSYTNPM